MGGKEKLLEFLTNLEVQIKSDEELYNSISVMDLNIQELKKDILNREIIIPVIGPFSAGKSSLINSFLGSDYLPVGITPETSLATEIRYSENERIECIKPGNPDKPDIYILSDFEKIKEKAQMYEYMIVYLNNPNLKKIQPVVLVDMPGFESPLDVHNKAIINYIEKGIFYIVVVSVESGTLPRSLLNRLKGLLSLNRDFELILTKVNLKPESDVLQIAEKIKKDVEDYLGLSKKIYLAGENGGNTLDEILTSLNTDKILKDIYLPSLKYITFQVIDTIETLISSLQKSVELNENDIKALEEEIENLHREKHKKVEEIKNKYSIANVNKVLSSLEKELLNQVDFLAQVAVTNPDKFSKIVNDMVINVLSQEVPDMISKISSEIIDDVSGYLKSTQSFPDLSRIIPSDWNDNLASQLKQSFLLLLKKPIEKYKNPYMFTTSILAIITNLLAPVLEVLIVALPYLIQRLLLPYVETKQKEKARSLIISQVIPTLKAQLRPKLIEFLNEEIKNLTTEVMNEFEKMLKAKKESIEQAQKTLKEKKEEISAKISKYQAIKQNIIDSYNRYVQ